MAQPVRDHAGPRTSVWSPWWQHTDLLMSVGLTALTAVLVIAFPGWRSPLRTFLGFTVILLLPGYVFQTLLFPKKGDVDGVERVALTLGLSIVVIPFLGLILNYTPWGIRLAPIAVGLTLAVALLGSASYTRRQNLLDDTAFFLDPRLRGVRNGTLLFALVVAVVGTVPSLAVALRPARHDTEFYVLGANGRLEDYPRTLAPGQPFRLTFGIANRSPASHTYTVRIPFEAKANQVLVPMLKPGATWQEPVDLSAPRGNGRTELDFDLYRNDDAKIYRHLRLFVNIRAGANVNGGAAGVTAPPATTGATQQTATAGGSAAVLARGFTSYRVLPGDTMYSIAKRFYGSGNEYPRIVAANRDRLKNFRKLPVGLVLRIPHP